jgi:phosphoserine phosphatase
MQADALNVFDLDGTLIKVNSFKEISKRLVITLAKKWEVVSLLSLICWYVIRKVGIIRHLKFKQKTTNIFDGKLTEEEKQNIVQSAFFANVNQGVFELMNRADNCVISTTAPFAFVSRMAFKKNVVVISSLDHNNVFPDPANFGPGKVENLKFYFKGKDVRVLNFYTDSADDQELVDFSVNAFMVRDGSLLKIK